EDLALGGHEGQQLFVVQVAVDGLVLIDGDREIADLDAGQQGVPVVRQPGGADGQVGEALTEVQRRRAGVVALVEGSELPCRLSVSASSVGIGPSQPRRRWSRSARGRISPSWRASTTR